MNVGSDLSEPRASVIRKRSPSLRARTLMGKGWAREASQPRAWGTRHLSSVRNWSESHELDSPGHGEAVTDRQTPVTSVPAPLGQGAAAPETTEWAQSPKEWVMGTHSRGCGSDLTGSSDPGWVVGADFEIVSGSEGASDSASRTPDGRLGALSESPIATVTNRQKFGGLKQFTFTI